MLIDLMRQDARCGVPRNARRTFAHALRLLREAPDPSPDPEHAEKLLRRALLGWRRRKDVVGVTVMVRPPPTDGRTNALWFHVDDDTTVADRPRTCINTYVVGREEHPDPYPSDCPPVWAHLVYRHRVRLESSQSNGVVVSLASEAHHADEHSIAWFDRRGVWRADTVEWEKDWWLQSFEPNREDPTAGEVSIGIHPHAYDPREAVREARRQLERGMLNVPVNEARRWAERAMASGMGVPEEWLRTEDVSFTSGDWGPSPLETYMRDRLAGAPSRPNVARAGASFIRERLDLAAEDVERRDDLMSLLEPWADD